ncbi:TPA: transposase [Streptococcus pneumoniae]
MHIHYNTNQTTLPLEISSFLPQDHLVFTIEKVVNTDEKEVNHLIKYAMFDKEQKRGYKQSARNLANWHYNDKEDSYTHPDGWYYRFHHTKHQKTQTDFKQEIKVYYADEPESAPQKGLYMNEGYQNLKAKECHLSLGR